MQLLAQASSPASWITLSNVALLSAAALIVLEKIITWREKRKKDSATEKAGDPVVLAQTSEIDEQIHERISQLRLASKACRVIIYLFHNGDHYFDGGPIQKMSCAYESVQGGTSRILDDQKSIVTSMMSGFLKSMYDNTPVINNTNSLVDAYCRTMLDDLSVSHFAVLPLHQNPQKIIGCLQVHWYAYNTERPETSQKIEGNPGFKNWFEEEISKVVHQIQYNLTRRLTISGVHSN